MSESLIESGRQLIVQGTAGGLVHVMLATSEIKDSSRNVIRLVANDPELGMQVFIDVNLHDGAAYHRAVQHNERLEVVAWANQHEPAFKEHIKEARE